MSRPRSPISIPQTDSQTKSRPEAGDPRGGAWPSAIGEGADSQFDAALVGVDQNQFGVF